jgi:hypothetical protein
MHLCHNRQVSLNKETRMKCYAAQRANPEDYRVSVETCSYLL